MGARYAAYNATKAPPMTALQFELVYNILSLTLASMMASTIFFWLRLRGIADRYQSALVITGLVTFIAAYHYFRIFNSWVEAYKHPSVDDCEAYMKANNWEPCLMHASGVPFNDAYRYMDWLPEHRLPLAVLGRLPLPVHLRRLHADPGHQGRPRPGGRPGHQVEDQLGPHHDHHLVAHLPHRLHPPLHGTFGCQCHRRCADRLHHLGHHLQVRCRPPHLQGHLRQVARRQGLRAARLSSGFEGLNNLNGTPAPLPSRLGNVGCTRGSCYA